jgi:hypothetical protein
VRLIKRNSSPLLGLQVGQPSSFSHLLTSIKDREGQIQEARGHSEAHQKDLLASTWPQGRTAFRQQEATVRLIKRISSPLLGLQVGQPSSFSLRPTSIKDREDQIQEAGGHCEAHQEDFLPSP